MQIPDGKPKNRRILWISLLVMDMHLHKTSQLEILRAMAERGHKVILAASYSSRKNCDRFSWLTTFSIPMRHVPFLSSFLYTLTLCLCLPLLILRLKPDFVIVEPNPTILSLISVFLFPKSRRPKVVLDIRTTPVSSFGVGGYVKTLFFGIAVSVANRLFQGMTTITDLMKREICGKYNLTPNSIGVWTSGVSTELFKSENYRRDELRRDFGLGGKFVVLYHGVFGKNRGTVEMIQAMKELTSHYPEKILLFLLGAGPVQVMRIATELGVRDKILLHKSVEYEDVPKYVAVCDVGIVTLPNLPDWRYQCPLNLLEYLAMEKVVIATDIPANREVLGSSKCGIYVSSADPREIAQAIVYAYENREQIPRWGSYGRTIVEERYTWAKVAKNLESYLLQI